MTTPTIEDQLARLATAPAGATATTDRLAAQALRTGVRRRRTQRAGGAVAAVALIGAVGTAIVTVPGHRTVDAAGSPSATASGTGPTASTPAASINSAARVRQQIEQLVPWVTTPHSGAPFRWTPDGVSWGLGAGTFSARVRPLEASELSDWVRTCSVGSSMETCSSRQVAEGTLYVSTTRYAGKLLGYDVALLRSNGVAVEVTAVQDSSAPVKPIQHVSLERAEAVVTSPAWRGVDAHWVRMVASSTATPQPQSTPSR